MQSPEKSYTNKYQDGLEVMVINYYVLMMIFVHLLSLTQVKMLLTILLIVWSTKVNIALIVKTL